MRLASAASFNPFDVMPRKVFDFSSCIPENKKTKGDALPKRIVIGTMSQTFGWRPSGVNPGQIKSFTSRFPQDFRLTSFGNEGGAPMFGGRTVCLP